MSIYEPTVSAECKPGTFYRLATAYPRAISPKDGRRRKVEIWYVKAVDGHGVRTSQVVKGATIWKRNRRLTLRTGGERPLPASKLADRRPGKCLYYKAAIERDHLDPVTPLPLQGMEFIGTMGKRVSRPAYLQTPKTAKPRLSKAAVLAEIKATDRQRIDRQIQQIRRDMRYAAELRDDSTVVAIEG